MGRPFSLSPRLQAVAELVPPGGKLADIGTDHGRLPVWLVRHGVIDYAIATDLREKPLSRAQALAYRWGVSDRISFRLCDGLRGIAQEEAEVVAVTGMGGETIAGILHAARWTGEHTYILQPMTGADGLRRYLSGQGFVILREVLVEEDGTLYLILLTRPGEAAPYTEGEIWAGRQTPGMDSPLRGRYLDQELSKLRRAVAGLSKAQRPGEAERRKHFELVASEVAWMKEEWDKWQA